MSASNVTKLFEFFSLIGQLKRVKRTGWVLRKVTDPESVADHMYRMSVLSLLIDKNTNLNKERCIKMSLVHDMAESIVGDIAPEDYTGIDKVEKHRREKSAMTHIVSLVSDEVGQELMHLWVEYEEQATSESQYVKDLDRFDMIFQAYEYEQLENKPDSLQEFFDSTEGKFKTENVRNWACELDKLRRQTSSLPKLSSPHLSQEQHRQVKDSATIRPFSVDHKETGPDT